MHTCDFFCHVIARPSTGHQSGPSSSSVRHGSRAVPVVPLICTHLRMDCSWLPDSMTIECMTATRRRSCAFIRSSSYRSCLTSNFPFIHSRQRERPRSDISRLHIMFAREERRSITDRLLFSPFILCFQHVIFRRSFCRPRSDVDWMYTDVQQFTMWTKTSPSPPIYRTHFLWQLAHLSPPVISASLAC